MTGGIETARAVYENVKLNGWKPLPGMVGGNVYRNVTQHVFWQEETIANLLFSLELKGAPRGSERVMADINTGRAWFTDLHYARWIDRAP